MTSNSGSIGNPIYNMLENINDVSALNEKEENPDSSDDVIYVDCLDQASASGSPSGDVDTVLQQPSGSKGRARGGRRKKRRNWRHQIISAANRKTACTKKGKRVQTNSHWDVLRPMLDVYCGRARGVLFKKKMKKGIREKCITVDPNGKLYTLPGFEVLGGYGRSKNWKNSIRCCCCKQMLKTLIKTGKLPKLPHFRKGKGKTPVHQASQVQPSDVEGLDQATASTAPGSPSGDTDILLQQPSGSKGIMVAAAEEPTRLDRACETIASQSVDSLFSDSIPAATSASNQRTDIPSSPHRTPKQSLNHRLQIIKGLMNDLEKALDMSDVKQQMTDIYQLCVPTND